MGEKRIRGLKARVRCECCKRKAGQKRRQADFKKTACFPSAVVQGDAMRKNGLCEESPRGN